MPYPWHYPYYMPPVEPGHPSRQTPEEKVEPPAQVQGKANPSANGNSSNPYVGSTSININFPMYMCPPPPPPPHSMQGVPYSMPPPPPSRYSMPHPPMVNPYMYQYNPYTGQD